MPAPVPITLKNKVYSTPILNGEMDDIAHQIRSVKDDIKELNNTLTDRLNTLQSLNNQLLVMHVQQTGSLPE
jgi:uncharacterized phage infection (PIP) family protein YhgE